MEKLCIRCVHSRRSPFSTGKGIYLCTRLQHFETDLVDGEKIAIGKELTCASERITDLPGTCGKQGRFFEGKAPNQGGSGRRVA